MHLGEAALAGTASTWIPWKLQKRVAFTRSWPLVCALGSASPQGSPSLRMVRQAMWLLLLPPERLTEEETAYREALCQLCPDVAIVYPLAQAFVQMVCTRSAEELEPWLKQAIDISVREVRRFALSLCQDSKSLLCRRDFSDITL